MTGGTANLNGLNVGFTGTGNLLAEVAAAITVTNNNVVIGGDLLGTFANANGTLVLDNATLTVTGTPPGSGTIFVGASGTGAFTAQNGSTIDTVDSYVGHLQGATGTATVDGSSVWTNSGSNYVGNSGTGVFNVLGGSTVDAADDTIVGANTTGNGTINISGAGSAWTTAGITILGGNLLTPVGGAGTINVSNGGSYVADGQLIVGLVGSGAVNVTGGGLTTGDSVYLGFSSGATGTVTISGGTAVWTANGAVTIVGGNDGSVSVGGNGTINILNGATFDSTAGDVVLGNDPSETSSGTVNVSGSIWDAGGIFVGESGNGTLNITDAATVSADSLSAGDCDCSQGTVNVSGGSTLTVTGNVDLGFVGIGTMNVSGAGTTVTSQDMTLGLAPDSVGTLNVSNSADVNVANLFVGFGGTGTANVQSGGSITATGNVVIGGFAGANGTLNVSGAGSTLTVGDSVVIGNGGVGTGALNVFDGGAVGITNTLFNADRLVVGAGSVITSGDFTAASDATTTIGLRGATSGSINLGAGTASLGGALIVTGHNMTPTTYTLIDSSGFGGTTFAAVTYADTLQNPILTYTPGGDLVLTVDTFILATSLPSNAGANQRNIAQLLDNLVAANGALPGGLDDLFNLSGSALLNGLTAVSGEIGATSLQSAFTTSNQFMSVLFGQMGGGSGGSVGAASYAAEKKIDPKAAEAYAAVTPRDRRAAEFASRWGVWASPYGGTATVQGNATLGSGDSTSRVFGLAAGAEYRFSPDTVAGFALGGAGASFGAQGGSGRADVFQAGAYVRHRTGGGYVSGGLVYSWQGTTTDRTVTIAGTDRLEADFDAHTLAARLEGGYHVPMSWGRLTPYAALQSTTFFMPSYSERATAGSPQFALSYSSQTQTNLRTELGLRSEKTMAMAEGILTLSGRAAWVHDTNTDWHANAAFQTVPGAAFTVNGAQPAADGVLLTAGAEMKWLDGWSLGGTVDGEFSSTTASYTGRATLKYVW